MLVVTLAQCRKAPASTFQAPARRCLCTSRLDLSYAERAEHVNESPPFARCMMATEARRAGAIGGPQAEAQVIMAQKREATAALIKYDRGRMFAIAAIIGGSVAAAIVIKRST